MTANVDPFVEALRHWGATPVISEVRGFDINPSTEQGAFECVILGILFAVDDTGPEVEITFNAMRGNGMTTIDALANLGNNPQMEAHLRQMWRQHYFNGRRTDKIESFQEIARRIRDDLNGDIRSLHERCGGDGEEMIRWLKSSGLGRKRFWLLREMRIDGVWNVDGSYCCVPDKQVETSLDRWHKKERKHSLRSQLECSRIVWQFFREKYDYPVFKYSRDFQCNDARQRQCGQCIIPAAQCKGRT